MMNLNGSLSNANLDSQIRNGKFSMDTAFGLECIYNDKVMLRLGRNSVNNLTGGIGCSWDGFGIDYAFISPADNVDIGTHHLISISLSV